MLAYSALTCFTAPRARVVHRISVQALGRRDTPLVLCSKKQIHSSASNETRADQLVDRVAKLVARHAKHPWKFDELVGEFEQLTATARCDLARANILAMEVKELHEATGTSSESTADHDAAVENVRPRQGGFQDNEIWLRRLGLKASVRVALECLLRGGKVGPQSGVFTDGSCSRNPGPGGWAALCVDDGKVLWAEIGKEKMTTNNRMEMQAVAASPPISLANPLSMAPAVKPAVNGACCEWRLLLPTDQPSGRSND